MRLENVRNLFIDSINYFKYSIFIYSIAVCFPTFPYTASRESSESAPQHTLLIFQHFHAVSSYDILTLYVTDTNGYYILIVGVKCETKFRDFPEVFLSMLSCTNQYKRLIKGSFCKM